MFIRPSRGAYVYIYICIYIYMYIYVFRYFGVEDGRSMYHIGRLTGWRCMRTVLPGLEAC